MPPALGVRAGEYRVGEVVARGAVGTTHRARHLTTGRIDAVTLLDTVAGDPVAILAFRAELPAIARLRHPNVLPVEAFGEVADVPYVVTPLPDGAEALSSRLARRGRLPRTATLRLLGGVAAAVDHAHRAGIVHGDLGPATVLVRTGGSALVRDFGLARLARASRPGGATSVHAGGAGSIAPELAHSDSAGPAADVYACAAIAYELLTGSPPLAQPSAPPSAREATIPPAADAVVLRGLAAEPGERWATCGEMVRALETALPGRMPASSVRLAGTLRRAVAGRSRGRRRAVVRAGLAGGAGLLLLTAVGAASLASRPAPGLSLSGNAVPAGGSLVVFGRNVPPGEAGTVVVEGGRGPAATFHTGSNGAFVARVTVPAGLSGRHRVDVCWGGSCRLSKVVDVLPAAGSPAPVITISDLAPERFESVEVQGYGFDPRQQYVIWFEQGDRRWLLQAPASPNGSGAFAVPVRIPGDAEPGPALMLSCGYQVDTGPTDRCAQKAVTVRP